VKGIIFTEFLEFVESNHGIVMVDTLISNCDLPSGGIYTSVSTYDVNELVTLIVELHRQTNVPVPSLIFEYGRHLFQYFVRTKGSVLAHIKSAEQLLASVENQIHVEVRKLYPDAELPSIRFETVGEGHSRVIYESSRPLADLADGLIHEAVAHFRDPLEIVRTDLGTKDGTHAIFDLKRKAQ
jgi:hypothetical protein